MVGLADNMTEQDRLLYQTYNEITSMLHALRAPSDNEQVNQQMGKEYIMGWNTCLTIAITQVMERVIEVQKRYTDEENIKK